MVLLDRLNKLRDLIIDPTRRETAHHSSHQPELTSILLNSNSGNSPFVEFIEFNDRKHLERKEFSQSPSN